MVSFLAALAILASPAQAPASQPPAATWAIPEFQDLKAGNRTLGLAASDALAKALAATKTYEIVPKERLAAAAAKLHLEGSPRSVPDLGRLAMEATEPTARERTIVAGEVVDYLVRKVEGGRQATALVRMVAYDAASALPVNGALNKGVAVGGAEATDEALVLGAVQDAVRADLRAMRRQTVPLATILNALPNAALLNQGTRAGFKAGEGVVIVRAGLPIGRAHVTVVEPDQAEIAFEGVTERPRPGDRVRAIFAPPPVLRPGILAKE